MTDGMPAFSQRLRVVILGLLVVSVLFAIQEKVEQTAANNDLPDVCAIRGQECPTTTTLKGVAVDAPPECIEAWTSGELAPIQCEDYPDAYSALREAGHIPEP